MSLMKPHNDGSGTKHQTTNAGAPGLYSLSNNPIRNYRRIKSKRAICCTYIFLGLEYFNDGILRKSLSLSATNVKSKLKAVAAIIASVILSL